MELFRLEGESDDELIWRIGSMKDKIGTWGDVADVINELTGNDYGESTYRKKIQSFNKIFNANQSKFVVDDAYANQIREQLEELKAERYRLANERLDLNRAIRNQSRVNETIDILEQTLSTIGRDRYADDETTVEAVDNDMVVCLSDLHIGATFDATFGGSFDSDIAKQRLDKYANKIIATQKVQKCNECNVFILGDLISGSIHYTISVTNKENVIEQVKVAAVYIADFIRSLVPHFNYINVFSVAGNHSRINPKKEDAVLGERLDDLVMWIVKIMLGHVQKVNFVYSEFDETLSVARIRNKTYCIVHGDYDVMSDAGISKLALYLGKIPDVVVAGHKHYPATTEVSGITVVQSGSLCGSGDQFTKQKRLKGKASQTFMIVNKYGIECIYPTTLE